MNQFKRILWLLSLIFAISARLAIAQVATTTVQDTIYSASGTPASGTVLVSWGAFTTGSGQAVPAGTTSATIGTGGVLTMALAPNSNAMPIGSYYTAVFHLSDGTTSREYWVVPMAVAGGGPAKLATIQNQVLPTSVAMQTVSKQYVDQAISAAQFGQPQAVGPAYVLITGSTMTGPLGLPADPVSPQQAADKNYVDENIAAVAGGLGQKVSELPSATQIVAQPSGTQLDVNLLNGELYASQYVTGQGSNGIANALASPDCASGCKLIIEPTYTGTDPVKPGNTLSDVVIVDQRGGRDALTAINPLQPGSTFSNAVSIAQTETTTSPQLEAERPGALAIAADALALSTYAPSGGSNLDPGNIESVPYFKSTYGVLSMTGTYNTQGQHIQINNTVHCYAVGDCLAGGQDIVSSGGYRDSGDEGTHPYDLQVREDFNVFQGSCAGGCTTGATQLAIAVTASQGSQGDGRFLMDKNPAKVISAGSIVSGGKTIFGAATFTGTSFPVSVFLTTAQSATSQPTNMAPGTVTLPIATSGVMAGYATSTAALPATAGVACVADVETGVPIPNFETAAYTVVDATHLQLTLNKPHLAGSTIAAGGLCGYGLEQTVDTVGAVRQVFPVIGSMDATDLYYADAGTEIVGPAVGSQTTSAYLNDTIHVASIARSGNVVTVTTVEGLFADVNGLTLTVSGVADPGYNGSFPVTTTGLHTLTYNSAGANSTSAGGTLSILTGGYALYPMAEVLSVLDPSDELIDGAFTLAANTVPWATGDAVEEPHYYQQLTAPDTEFISQFVPRPTQYTSAGKTYDGNVGPGLRGWQITNNRPASDYLGAGGTHNVPDDAFIATGPWHNDFEVDAGTGTLLYVHCNIEGCNRWDSGYALFFLDSSAGEDQLTYQPQNSTATWILRNTEYSFSPSAFTAGTINVGTLNATTITGGVSGSAISAGTVSAARLPLFGPSGTTHAPGIVPDPGPTAGATHYLREDGTWSVPDGGSGSPAPGNFTTGSFTGNISFTGAAPSDSGNGNPTLDWGTYYGSPDLLMYDAGPGARFGWGLRPNEMQFFILSNSHYSFNGCGDFQSSGACENMRLTNANDTLSLGSSGVYGFGSTGISSSAVDTGISRDSAGVFDFGNGTAGNASGTLKSSAYVGPSAAPSGSCSTNGAWVFSQDGHATFCAAGTWVTKI